MTVKAKKKSEPVADNPVLSSRDVTLYYLSDKTKDYIQYDRNHLREYRFRVSGTKKQLWEKAGKSREQKHRRMLESMKGIRLKEVPEDPGERIQIRFS